MSELEDFCGNKIEIECMGCDIASNKIKVPGGFIYEGKYSVLALDPLIPIPGFLIITLKRHVDSFSKLEKAEREEIDNIIYMADKALKELNIVEKVTIIQEERSSHFHVWILPNHKWLNEKYGIGIKYVGNIIDDYKFSKDKDLVSKSLQVGESVKKYFEDNMNKNYKVITLCGSTKFKDEFMEVQKELTLKGNIVISVGSFGHSDDEWNNRSEEEKQNLKVMLDDIHRRKIDMADEIFVINVNGYIGKSTKGEIEYAKQHGKKINYLEKVNEN